MLTYVAVDDCGRVLNQYLVDAQIHGALAQGIGQALYEEVLYDEVSGQLLTGTMMDYALPNAQQVPSIVTAGVETPSQHNPLGAKGVGEAGCIGAPPAVVNAVLDALAPLGIKTIDMPLKSEKVWALMQAAQEGMLEQLEPTATSLYQKVCEQGFAPPECQECETVFGSMIGSFHMIFLPFMTGGKANWDWEQKLWIVKDGLRRYTEERREFLYEWKRIGKWS